MSKTYFIGTVALVITVAVLNFFAYRFHWYWRFWWFDMIMHTLGGVWVASVALWYRFSRHYTGAALARTSAFSTALAAVLLVGTGWELFEFSVDTFIAFSRHNPADTASDLFFDVLGSGIAVFLFFLVYNKSIKLKDKPQTYEPQ